MHPHHEISTLPSGTIIHHWTLKEPRSSLILQHGFAEYAERYVDSYHQIIPRLIDLRVEVWAMDMWGHGRSPGIRGMVDVTKAVEDHRQLRDQVSKRGLPIYLLGHSLGGLVTVGSVMDDSSSIQGVLLTGPALPSSLPMPLRWVVDMGARYFPNKEVPIKKQPLSGISSLSQEVQRAEADSTMYKGQVSFLTAKTALQTMEMVWQKIETWTVPTIVLHGLEDRYTEPEQSERFVVSIRSTDKTVHLIPGGLHELLNDSMREEMLQIILKWLDEHIERQEQI